MAGLWIEWTDSTDEDGSARWSEATDKQIDAVLAYAEQVLGKADTIA